ncbi:MAG TPA: MFS transporter [Conexibacter sp.]
MRVNPPVELLYARKWKIFSVMMVAWLMTMLDVSIVNITVPTLQQDFSASLGTVSWVVNAYNIVFAVLLVAMGKLADQFGRKRLFVIGLSLFTLGSALCALSWSVYALIGFRILQGAGAGILAPLGFAMAALVFPPAQRGRAIATIALVALVSNALGPVVGGALLELLNWHWIFLVNVPIGIVALAFAFRWWPETYDLNAGRGIDWAGMALLAGAVSTLAYALVATNSVGFTDPTVLFFIQISLVLWIGFVLSQRYGKTPMLTRALVANKQFASANATMLLVGAGAVGTLFLLSLVFMNLWGLSPLEAGLALLPVPICGLLTWPVVGRAADHAPPYRIAIPALAIMAIGMIWFSFLPSSYQGFGDYLRVVPGLVLIGVGMGTTFPSINVGAMGAVSGPELGLASGVLNTSRQLGTAIGVSLLIAVFAGASQFQLGYAKDDIENVAYDAAVPTASWQGLVARNYADFAGGATTRLPVGQGFDRYVREKTATASGFAFGWAFRVAGILLLMGIPFARRMRQTPAMARAAAAAAAERAAAAAGAGAGPDPVGQPAGAPDGVALAGAAAGGPAAPPAGVAAPPAGNGSSIEHRISELETTLNDLREELASARDGEGERS